MEPSVAATQDEKQPSKRDRVAAVGPKKGVGSTPTGVYICGFNGDRIS